MSILAVIIGNLITIFFITVIIYFIYKENKEKVNNIKELILSKVDEIENIISDIDSAINKIEEFLEKLPLNNSLE